MRDRENGRTKQDEYDLAVLYAELSADQVRYVADRWKSEKQSQRLFGGITKTRRNIILAIPVLVVLYWLGDLMRERDIRSGDSTVLNYLRDASKKNGNQALLPALHEADEYYREIERNERADYEDHQ